MNQLSIAGTPTTGAVQTPTPTGPIEQGRHAAASVPIAKGATVVDVRGEKVGTALEYDAMNQYLRVEHGWLVPVLIYVPLYAITRSNGKHIQLAVSKDDALNGRWPTLPVTAPPDNSMPVSVAYVGVNLTVGNAAHDNGVRAQGNGTTVPPTSATPGGNASAGWATSAAPPAPPVSNGQGPDEVRIPRVEERLVVGARREQIGMVRVHKAIVEEQQTIPVALRHEVVTIEHVPASADADPATVANAFTPQDIVIPVMAERAVVTKEAHIVEEVHVHKQNVTEEHTISGTVRKMHVSVDGPVGNAA